MMKVRYRSYFICHLLWLEKWEGWTKDSGNSEAFVIIEVTYWFAKSNGFSLKKQDPAIGAGRAEFWRTFLLPSFGLSQHSEGCPTLGAHQVPFHPLGLISKTNALLCELLLQFHMLPLRWTHPHAECFSFLSLEMTHFYKSGSCQFGADMVLHIVKDSDLPVRHSYTLDS